jgi:hypothetical protein
MKDKGQELELHFLHCSHLCSIERGAGQDYRGCLFPCPIASPEPVFMWVEGVGESEME